MLDRAPSSRRVIKERVVVHRQLLVLHRNRLPKSYPFGARRHSWDDTVCKQDNELPPEHLVIGQGTRHVRPQVAFPGVAVAGKGEHGETSVIVGHDVFRLTGKSGADALHRGRHLLLRCIKTVSRAHLNERLGLSVERRADSPDYWKD